LARKLQCKEGRTEAANQGGRMSDTCKHGRLLESFYTNPDDWEPCPDCLIESLRADHVSKKELREWLNSAEVPLKESEEYKIGYSEALDNVFIKFCKEADDDREA